MMPILKFVVGQGHIHALNIASLLAALTGVLTIPRFTSSPKLFIISLFSAIASVISVS
jgi:hypothetical protein